jgi:hypothetical protein
VAYKPTPAGPRNIREMFHYLWRELTRVGEAIGTEGGGEANTASNLGTGEGLVTPKEGVNLPFKSLIGGANITLAASSTTITINGDSSGGGSVPDGGAVNTVLTKASAADQDTAWALTVHGNTTGLDADDHPQYFDQARGDARYAPILHDHDAGNF